MRKPMEINERIFRFMGSLHGFATAHWDHERWGETPSSRDYSVVGRSGLDRVSPHQVISLFCPSITRDNCPHPLGSVRRSAADGIRNPKRRYMAVVKEIIESFAVKAVGDRSPGSSSAARDLVRRLISGTGSGGTHAK